MSEPTIRVCPECGSSEIYPEMGFMTGYQYHCPECGYVGAFVLERDLEDEVDEEVAKAKARAEAEEGATAAEDDGAQGQQGRDDHGDEDDASA